MKTDWQQIRELVREANAKLDALTKLVNQEPDIPDPFKEIFGNHFGTKKDK